MTTHAVGARASCRAGPMQSIAGTGSPRMDGATPYRTHPGKDPCSSDTFTTPPPPPRRTLRATKTDHPESRVLSVGGGDASEKEAAASVRLCFEFIRCRDVPCGPVRLRGRISRRARSACSSGRGPVHPSPHAGDLTMWVPSVLACVRRRGRFRIAFERWSHPLRAHGPPGCHVSLSK